MRPQLTDGVWFEVKNEAEHANLMRGGCLTDNSRQSATVELGKYCGPGLYLVLSYLERCPRNCCYDSVREVLSKQQVSDECPRELERWQELIREYDPCANTVPTPPL